MKRFTHALAIVALVLATACSGGPTTPLAPDPPFESTLTADDIAFVEGTDVGSGLEASGAVVAVRFGAAFGDGIDDTNRDAIDDAIRDSGQARGNWELSVERDSDRHRVRGQLSLRARTADGETIRVRARISRAAFRDDREGLRFAGVARLHRGDVVHEARLRGTIGNRRIRLRFLFRGGGEAQIVGRVEEFQIR